MSKTQVHESWQALIAAADQAGQGAVMQTTPAPMLVGTPRNMLASLTGGDDGGFDEKQPVYFVEGGVCGFAWVSFKATESEGRRFLNWLKGSVKSTRPLSAVQPSTIGEPSTDSYYGGVSAWVRGFGQSMARKEAYAQAFARTVREAGIEGLTVYSASRMD
ncbi:MAG: hypothetical protein H0U84_08555 [Thermoleophilaceae bacterium]|nr:hypothetical protein [Thermoleophilaceae bacterium]